MPLSEIVLVRPVDLVELFHEGIFELVMRILSVSVVAIPAKLVAKAIEFVGRRLCGIIFELGVSCKEPLEWRLGCVPPGLVGTFLRHISDQITQTTRALTVDPLRVLGRPNLLVTERIRNIPFIVDDR